MIDLAKLAAATGVTDPDLGPWMTDYGDSEAAIRAFAAAVLEEAAKVCDAEEDNIGSPATYCGRLIRALIDNSRPPT